ncbi:ATP-binding protein [Dyadobacter sp. CY345]|uniref:ATP-binding response regulator n=1 Tax=Dyadobacter sp. CY345 TaxID=2909335 RepID=UPI001F468771|nr:ATP-binding protein [Dyadobacter sp. CY345]MCF2442406.1 ATP-binding protein [Dyadobacter sp. CY345]
MKNDINTVSYKFFAWTIVLILILTAFVFITLITNSKSDAVKNNIRILQTGNNNYARIDTCISVLYTAENNSRLFAVTADSAYLDKYTRQMETVSSILREFQEEKKKQTLFFNLYLPKLLLDKQVKTDEFIRLRNMVDSLLLFYTTGKKVNAPTIDLKPHSFTNIKKFARTESVLIEPKNRNKKFWKRIVEAVSNKSTDSGNVQKKTIRTVTTIEDSVTSLRQRNDHEHVSNIRNLGQARSRLKKAELELLTANARIFSNLQSALKALRNEEINNLETLRMSLLSQTSDKLSDWHQLSWGNIAVVIILTIIIIRNILQLYRNEVTIIKYSNQTVISAKKKGEFLSHISHEIRTPLNAIIGFSRQIEESKTGDDLRMKVGAIKNASDVLMMLINEMLDFSRFESGKIKLVNRQFKPLGMLDDVVDMLSVLAFNKEISLTRHFELAPGLILLGDDYRLKQVALNLLTNAIKFTPNGGRISILAEYRKTDQPSNGVLKIVVKDSGIGIAQENIEKIFDDFTQIETPSEVPRQTGTGLGLPIARRIVDLFGGKINVTSELGKGAVFSVEVPMVSVEGNIVMSQEPNTVKGIGSIMKDKRVLMVDDIKINLLLLSRILDKNGVCYDLASDGEEAFKLFQSTSYDLIITDVQMPKMDGLELTRCVRNEVNRIKARIPVIGYTASTSPEERSKYLDYGMNDLLDKPFTENDLVEVLERVIL